MGQLISIQVQIYQMCHAISEHGRIDFFQIIFAQIEHVQVSEARECIRRKFVDRVSSQSQFLQRILQTTPIIRRDLWYFVTCRTSGSFYLIFRILSFQMYDTMF